MRHFPYLHPFVDPAGLSQPAGGLCARARASPVQFDPGIVWQWVSVTNQTTKQTTTVPNPENYTIVFNADGTLVGKADCNTFDGTYSQENGFTIKLGASTMMYCGDARWTSILAVVEQCRGGRAGWHRRSRPGNGRG